MPASSLLQREVTDADDKLKRRYRLVEAGLTEMDNVLKDRLNTSKADRDRAKPALERARSHSALEPSRSTRRTADRPYVVLHPLDPIADESYNKATALK